MYYVSLFVCLMVYETDQVHLSYIYIYMTFMSECVLFVSICFIHLSIGMDIYIFLLTNIETSVSIESVLCI